MIVVTIIRDGSGNIIGMDANGHANFNHPGADIVCAGVSALTYAVYAALKENLNCTVRGEAEHGLMNFAIVNEPSKLTHTVFGVGITGLKAIEKAYPGRLQVLGEDPR